VPADVITIAAALSRLDTMLTAALRGAGQTLGAPHPFRGLYVDEEEATRLLQRAPLAVAGVSFDDGEHPLEPLAGAFALDCFELDVALLALAPELDLRYERVYGYLQDDVTARSPRVSLALDLLCATPAQKVERRARFAPDAPLRRHRIVELGGDEPLLRRTLRLDPQVLRAVIGGNGIDERLDGVAALTFPERTLTSVPQPDRVLRALAHLASHAARPLLLGLVGPAGVGQTEIAEALAFAAGTSLLHVAGGADAVAAAREARLRNAVLLVEEPSDPEALPASGGVVLLACDAEPPPEWIRVELAPLSASRRRACWSSALADVGIEADATVVDALGARFRLTADEIRRAAIATRDAARWAEAGGTPANVFAAARRGTGTALPELARKVELVHGWDDLVVPDGVRVQLRELCDRVLVRDRVVEDWGFGERLGGGNGVAALFAGASGTGKTMAAAVIAREAELDLFRIHTAAVVSKWIGETERNLDRVFDAAEGANAILLFDEADALFGKRSSDQNDTSGLQRYANLEVAYLLQRMESFSGISILSTNLRQNLDEAFTRRLDSIVNFPFPDEAERRDLWTRIWPATTPLAADVDVERLARVYPLTGGSIKNAAVGAAYLAAAHGGLVTHAHIAQAVTRELEKDARRVAAEAVA
jgi:ATP-dependent 26S proteasome regulatory subunit